MKHFYLKLFLCMLGFGLILPTESAQAARGNKKMFITKYSPIEFTFPTAWKLDEDKSPYDLSCVSEDDHRYTGVFVFKRVDLPTSMTPVEKLNAQIKDMESKRNNFQIYEALSNVEIGSNVLTSVTYVADQNTSRYCYRYTLIEFKGDQTRFAIVTQTCFPGDWKRAKPVFESITNSARPLKDEDEAISTK